MEFKSIRTEILSKLKEVQQEKILYDLIYENAAEGEGKNELLFFIKPELTVYSEKIQYHEIINLIFNKIQAFAFTIKNIRILSASYLDENNIIARHYGVINKLADNPLGYLSEDAAIRFQQLFKVSVKTANVKGSFEFLKENKTVSAEALDYICQNSKSEKLSGGTYVNRLIIDGKELFLINGFHPRQIKHFTKPGRSIIAFTLTGNTHWSVARNDFVGKTNPSEANKGSIRNELLVNKDKLGLQTVSPSWNGVHLSAGPVEGLVELMRYNSDYTKKEIKSIKDFAFGLRLAETFPENKIEALLENTVLQYNHKTIPVFDLTEELNSKDAIEILKKADFLD